MREGKSRLVFGSTMHRPSKKKQYERRTQAEQNG